MRAGGSGMRFFASSWRDEVARRRSGLFASGVDFVNIPGVLYEIDTTTGNSLNILHSRPRIRTKPLIILPTSNTTKSHMT